MRGGGVGGGFALSWREGGLIRRLLGWTGTFWKHPDGRHVCLCPDREIDSEIAWLVGR